MISIFLSAVLLLVSSAPLVSAVACDMPPAHAAAMQGEDIHTASSMSHMHGESHHAIALSTDLDTCRLECGCGCHRSIDSLPNLLAPHSADAGIQPENVNVERATSAPCIRLSPRVLSLTSPPPDFV